LAREQCATATARKQPTPSKDRFFLSQQGEIFVIDEILSEVKPILYRLKDLMGDPVPGFYYGAQLVKTEEPKDSDYQLVEKILDTKIVNSERFYLVKFLFYPGKSYLISIIF